MSRKSWFHSECCCWLWIGSTLFVVMGSKPFQCLLLHFSFKEIITFCVPPQVFESLKMHLCFSSDQIISSTVLWNGRAFFFHTGLPFWTSCPLSCLCKLTNNAVYVNVTELCLLKVLSALLSVWSDLLSCPSLTILALYSHFWMNTSYIFMYSHIYVRCGFHGSLRSSSNT